MLKVFSRFKNQVKSVLKRINKVAMSDAESIHSENIDVYTQKLNPLTGEYSWVVQDENYDFHQEIARSAFADMLHDSERNDKYYAAIKAVIEQTHQEGREAHVLDIGTGTGLLAMMAARCGADTIYACEAFSPISKCAEKVIQENGLADRITVIHKRSTNITVGENGDMPWRANILVTEVFDTELIGEGAIGTFNHAHKHLLEKDCLVVPTKGTVYAQVVESSWMQRWNHLTPWEGVAPSKAIRQCPGAAAVHDLQLSQLRQDHFKIITRPTPVFSFDWTGRDSIPENDNRTVLARAVKSGSAEMVFMWWSLNMDPGGRILLSCAPWWAHPSHPPGPEAIPWRDHWMQAVYYLPKSVTVQKGENLKLVTSHDEFSFWFNLTVNESFSSSLKGALAMYAPLFYFGPDTKPTKRPVCDCMLHVSCSRTRIGMLNDPVRRDSYLKVLRKLITPESVVMSFGETSLLGLLTATLGASKVYHVEENCLNREVMEGMVRENNLRSKVTILGSSFSLDKNIAASVTLVVGEPYFMTALFPWHITRWWILKQQCPNAVGMPESASLYIMPMQFDHLHKIRATLGTISGFKMTAFDEIVQNSSSISDSSVEVHPLWEYPGICLGHPKEVVSFNCIQNFYSAGTMAFNVSGTWHGMVLWVDIKLDAETTVSTGPVVPPVLGAPVQWDPYTRQAVYFMLPEIPVTDKNFLQYKAVFDRRQNDDDIQFTFNLQNDDFHLPVRRITEPSTG